MIAARFAEVVRAHPGLPALRRDGRTWAYAELDRAAAAVAAAVSARLGDGPPAPVALLVGREHEIPCLLGVLRAGHAYAFVEPAQLAALRPRLVLAEPASMVDGAIDVTTLPPAEHAPVARAADDLAAIIFTSGSTGGAKGVLRSHRAILHRADLAAAAHAVGPGDVVSHLHACRFVAAEGDVFGALLAGATVASVDVQRLGFGGLADWLVAEGVTLFHPPVPVFRRFLHALPRPLAAPRLRLVALGGEPLFRADVELADRLLPPAARLEHRFSSSEAGTITTGIVDRSARGGPPLVPVGRPVAGKRVQLIRPDGEPADEGEIVVESDALASGLLGGDGFAGRYRTGDLGRWLPSGELEHLGRNDRLVKIRGQRVSLHEVEAALLALAGVKEVAAVVGRDALGEPRVEAFVDGDLPSPEALERVLPPAARPARVNPVAGMPLTGSGKLDRAALAAGAQGELARVWSELLGRPPEFAPDDDFFALGGDSLLLAELAARMERRTGRRVELQDLAGGRSFAAHAALFSAPRPAPGTSLVPLATGGARPPFFCVHAHSGAIAGFGALARHLGPGRPFYALEARGLPTIPAMARAYLDEIRRVQPRGPYRLGGRCLGGAIALEMASTLVAAGERVALVVIFDMRTPPARSRPHAIARALRDAFWHRRGDAWAPLLDLVGAPAPPPPRGLNALHTRARMTHYARVRYPGRVVIFAPPEDGRRPARLGDWDRIVRRGVDWQPLPGPYHDVFAEPRVRDVAADLGRWLDAP